MINNPSEFDSGRDDFCLHREVLTSVWNLIAYLLIVRYTKIMLELAF